MFTKHNGCLDETIKMEKLLLGCSGWNYGDTSEKRGWVGVFYPDKVSSSTTALTS
jgi:hypothetical protein